VGFFYYHPVGIAGTDERYWSRWFWPPLLYDGMGELNSGGYYTATDYGIPVAIAFETGAPERFELLRRFVGTTDPATGAATIRGWGLEAPDAQTAAPYDQWAVLLGELD